MYRDLGQPLLEKALEGYNATIFAYGQVSLVTRYMCSCYSIMHAYTVNEDGLADIQHRTAAVVSVNFSS